jgi:pentatricopeptide repeat domain-containing protein 1
VAETLYLFMTTEININPTIVTINTLIDQYFKNNLPEKAWEIFESLKTIHKSIKPDNFTYTTLINGLKSNRDGMDLNRAFTLFEEYK